MATTIEAENSTEIVFHAARLLPREDKIVLIEMLASSLREDESLDPDVIADAERRWAEIEAGTAKTVSLADLDHELRAKYQWP